jgi:hypothetical protein
MDAIEPRDQVTINWLIPMICETEPDSWPVNDREGINATIRYLTRKYGAFRMAAYAVMYSTMPSAFH